MFLSLLFLSESQASGTELGVSANLRYFNYEEFELGGASSNQETGFIPGIGLSLRQQNQLLSAELYDGTVKYDGQLQSGTPHITDTNETVSKFAYRHFIPFELQPEQHTYYLGMNYQKWQRDILPRNNINGLFETYRWFTAEAGLQSFIFKQQQHSLLFEVGVIYIFNADIKIDLTNYGHGEPLLKLKDKPGLQAGLKYNLRLSATNQLNAGIDYIHSKFGRSDPAIINNGFEPITIDEPDSTTNHISLFMQFVQEF